jgi:hypothetical protein
MEFAASPLARELNSALARYTQWEHPLRRYRALNYGRLNKGGYTWEDYHRGLAELEEQLRWEFDPRTRLDPLFVQLCATLLQADAAARDNIRQFVAERKSLGQLLWRYANRLSTEMAAAGRHAALLLERALAAITIENCSTNYRDTQMTLADLFVAAELVGVDPQAAFAAAADRATDDLTDGGCNSLAALLREFHASSVLAERRALGEPYGGPV